MLEKHKSGSSEVCIEYRTEFGTILSVREKFNKAVETGAYEEHERACKLGLVRRRKHDFVFVHVHDIATIQHRVNIVESVQGGRRHNVRPNSVLLHVGRQIL